jgi:hypothetical protein
MFSVRLVPSWVESRQFKQWGSCERVASRLEREKPSTEAEATTGDDIVNWEDFIRVHAVLTVTFGMCNTARLQ